jgi:hypothetical protein
MRVIRTRYRRGFISESLKRLGEKIAREDGIKPLQPGESRPIGYYTVDHFTGLSGFPPGAVVHKSD